MAITKYGLGLVLGSWVLFFVFFMLAVWVRQPVIIGLAILVGLFSVFNMFFFRDPQRQVPQNPAAIISPADGKVVQVTEVNEHDFFKEKVARLSIFLSVFNVHVNRVPVTGRVEYFNYHRGGFAPAFKESASLENEQTVIGIVDESRRKIMFSQIAGLIARRIVCNLREGHEVKAGERMGMIRYGSRVDIFYKPDEVELQVKVGDKVKGGESIIGVFK